MNWSTILKSKTTRLWDRAAISVLLLMFFVPVAASSTNTWLVLLFGVVIVVAVVDLCLTLATIFVKE